MMSYYILIMWLEEIYFAFCMWMFGSGLQQFNYRQKKKSHLCVSIFLLVFQNNGQAFIQSKNLWHR